MFVPLVLCAFITGADPANNAKTVDPDALLIQAGRRLGVRSILTGDHDPVLQALAREQALYSASHGLGHQLFGQQFARFGDRYPHMRSIAAQSWPGQNVEQAASDCYDAWKQSSGHWSICNGACRKFGFSMIKGSDGIWYGIAFCSD